MGKGVAVTNFAQEGGGSCAVEEGGVAEGDAVLEPKQGADAEVFGDVVETMHHACQQTKGEAAVETG